MVSSSFSSLMDTQTGDDLTALGLIEQVESLFTHPKTEKMLLDEYVLNYVVTAFRMLDYQDSGAFTQMLDVIPPILTSLNVTASDEAGSDILQRIYDAQSALHGGQGVSEQNFALSANLLMSREAELQRRFAEKQAARDLLRQRLDYSVQKIDAQRNAKRVKNKAGHPSQQQGSAAEGVASTSEAAFSGVSHAAVELNAVTLAFGSNVLLDNVSFQFHFGHRYCLVARNGAGKSTLLKGIFSNEIHCISSREKLNVLYVAQEVPSTSDSVIDVVLAADEVYVEEARLQKELEGYFEDMQAVENNHSAISNIEALLEREIKEVTEDDIEMALNVLGDQEEDSNFSAKRARAAKILSGLMFSHSMQNKPTRELSGGWKMRVSLARAIFIDPDILMLDEPTNNLDLLATLWLEEQMKNFSKRGLLIVVSHDIEFIDEFATDVVLLAGKKLKNYPGNYSSFAHARENEAANLGKQHEREEQRRAHVQSFIDRFRYNAKRASLVQSRIKALSKMNVTELSIEQVEAFTFPQPYPDDYEHSTLNPLAELKDVCFSYDSDKLGGFHLHDISIRIFSDSRIAICGANAAGKSTILRLLTGCIKQISGEVKYDQQASFAIFWQHHTEQLDLEKTAFEELQALASDAREPEIRAHLSSFGITAQLGQQIARTLSGGQKTRLSLALLTFRSKARVLVMDEPTNHIDVETKEALIEALQAFNGALVVVSHDGPFVNAVTDEMYVVEGGRMSAYAGGFDDYREELRRAFRK